MKAQQHQTEQTSSQQSEEYSSSTLVSNGGGRGNLLQSNMNAAQMGQSEEAESTETVETDHHRDSSTKKIKPMSSQKKMSNSQSNPPSDML